MEPPLPTQASATKPRTIVALIDFSDVSTKILDHARMLAKTFSSNVVLMHGVPQQPDVVDIGLVSPVTMRDPNATELDLHKAKLLEICDSFRAAGINATAAQSDHITAEDVAAESRWLEADLIIMGSHHHSALHDLFVGNLTHDLLQRATCPVLVIPAEVPSARKREEEKVAETVAA
jgi:nucleotide-binding universal stress UspA family protein